MAEKKRSLKKWKVGMEAVHREKPNLMAALWKV
jgi:hypothetical protein